MKVFCMVYAILMPVIGFAQGRISRSTTSSQAGTPTKQVRVGMPVVEGETWSYTKHVSGGSISTFYVFTSKTDVVWLFGTPFGNYFPVGFGKYNPSTNNVTFSASHKLHKYISLYYSGEDIVFNIDRDKKTAMLKSREKSLGQLYNEGNRFAITKENFKLTPNSKLVGSTWIYKFEDENYEVYFKTWNEVVLRGGEDGESSCAYVCIDNMIAIKSGDNIDDENLIGTIKNGNEVTLFREGLNPDKRRKVGVTLYEVADSIVAY